MPKNLDISKITPTFALEINTSRDGAVVARWAHNPKVGGSSPPPATKPINKKFLSFFRNFYFL